MADAFPQPYPPTYPPDLPDETVFYVDMEDLGNKGIDHVGGNHVTWTGATNIKKPYGNSKYFNGGGGYGSVSNTPSIDITTAPFSCFAWIKPDSASPTTGYIFSKNITALSDMQYGMYWSTSLALNVVLNSSTQTIGGTVPSGVWSLVGFAVDGVNLFQYINGKYLLAPVTYSTFPLTERSTGIEIGRRKTNNALFKGSMGEIWIIKDALKLSGVHDLFNETAWKYGVKI